MHILHILRAPVGGLFRHVGDLARYQSAAGHAVGVLCDSTVADALTEQRLSELKPDLALGLHRCAMPRLPGVGDIAAARETARIAAQTAADIIHGHGAKGGTYARLANVNWLRGRASGAAPRVFYTPHGGSLHYDRSTVQGRLYLAVERKLAAVTDGIVFESTYSQRRYDDAIGANLAPARVIPNGLAPADFAALQHADDTRDIVFVGELRHLKGVDLLLQALAQPGAASDLTATIVGDGPDRAAFEALAGDLGLGGRVVFTGALPTADAFRRGRVLAMPSRAESFPYVILEAAAVGLPIVATNVGGIPEIVAGTDTSLIAADNVDALSAALLAATHDPTAAAAKANRLRAHVASAFTVERMGTAIDAFYSEAINDAS
ncbi:MAG: glycosyltransferase family 4 protein [Pseudomonadota bacterium]